MNIILKLRFVIQNILIFHLVLTIWPAAIQQVNFWLVQPTYAYDGHINKWYIKVFNQFTLCHLIIDEMNTFISIIITFLKNSLLVSNWDYIVQFVNNHYFVLRKTQKFGGWTNHKWFYITIYNIYLGVDCKWWRKEGAQGNTRNCGACR